MATKNCKLCKEQYNLTVEKARKCVDDFNRKFPVGTAVWYWRSKFGPVQETSIRDAAFLSDADMPVVFLNDVSGYVCIYCVTEPRENQRAEIVFVD